jgi:hypothetical protein
MRLLRRLCHDELLRRLRRWLRLLRQLRHLCLSVSCIGDGCIEVVATWVFSVMAVELSFEGLIRCECYVISREIGPPSNP